MDPSVKLEQARPGIYNRLSTVSTADLMCSYDLHGYLIDINEALENVLGYSRQEVLGMRLSDLLDPASWELARQNILEHVGGGATGLQQIKARAKAGHAVPLEMTTQLVFENGMPVALQGFGRSLLCPDAAAWWDAEARLSTTSTALARFTRHLKQLHRLSTTNYESLADAFADFLKTGCEVFGLDIGCVLQVEGEDVIVRAIQGFSERLHPGARLPVEGTGFASLADRLRTRSGGAPATALDPDFGISIATPILVDAELFGMLSFSSPKDRAAPSFSREEKEVIELMARSIGRFVLEDRIQSERKSVENLERNRNRVLEMVTENRPVRETLRRVETLVESQSPGSRCFVLLLRNGALPCDAARANGIGLDGFLPPESGGVKLAGHAPVWSGSGTLLGAIALYRPGASRPEPPDSELLCMASRLASIAIEQRQLTDRLEFQAQHDFLTGLTNRSRLLELLNRRLAEARERGGILAVLFIDLDRFKQINDTLGHAAGDQLLIEVAGRLRDEVNGDRDIVARMGGDEFTVVFCDPAGEEAAARTSRQFLNALRMPYFIEGRELFVTASIGMSFYPNHGADAEALIRAADAAMYLAKKEGKNALECFVSEARHDCVERLDLENSLRRALEKSELELYFQPIVSISGELAGLEALLVWNHATLGRLAPGRFIPIAEETGLIVPIGTWVLHQACALGARWVAKGLPLKRIAVNVSALQFSRADFVGIVAAALDSTGLAAERLELELTESLVLRDIDESVLRMARLRELGVSMAIDDFGTGYSSLNYLRRLPVSGLKIDQSFLRDLPGQAGAVTVVESIVALAHNMNLSVVAEGVETLEELDMLRAAGCDEVQGHLYGASIRAPEAERLLLNASRQAPRREN